MLVFSQHVVMICWVFLIFAPTGLSFTLAIGLYVQKSPSIYHIIVFVFLPASLAVMSERLLRENPQKCP